MSIQREYQSKRQNNWIKTLKATITHKSEQKYNVSNQFWRDVLVEGIPHRERQCAVKTWWRHESMMADYYSSTSRRNSRPFNCCTRGKRTAYYLCFYSNYRNVAIFGNDHQFVPPRRFLGLLISSRGLFATGVTTRQNKKNCCVGYGYPHEVSQSYIAKAILVVVVDDANGANRCKASGKVNGGW